MARRRARRRLSRRLDEVCARRPPACSSTTRPATARASMRRTTRLSCGCADNRGFAGGANAGLGRAFEDGAEHAVLLNDDVLVEPGCVEALVSRCRARAGPPRRASTARRAFAFAGGELEPKRGFGRHVDGRDRLSQRRVPLHLARRLGARRAVRRAALPVLRGRRLVPPRPRARRAADGRARCARRAQRRALDGRRAGRDLGLLLDAQPALAARAAAGLARARREACARACAPAARALQSARRAVARAKLAGVRDWSERRMGRGPWPREGRLRRRLPDADARGHGAPRRSACATRSRARPTSS